MKATLGQKLKYYRKRAGMSQLNLEDEANLAPGTISRIENGKVNPTKETVVRIAKVLKIKSRELNDLLEFMPLLPTTEEIQDAVAEIQQHFSSPDVYAYLNDEWGTLYYFSKGFIDMFGFDMKKIETFVGVNILDLILNPKYGVRQKLDVDMLITKLPIEILRIKKDVPEFTDSDIYLHLKTLPGFDRVEDTLKKVKDEDILSPDNKAGYFKVGNQKIKMNFSREPLKCNKRFEVIEYFNPQVY